MDTFEYTPKRVCSTKMIFNIEGNTIKSLKTINGCPGNGLGVSALVKDQDIDVIINKLENIKCGIRNTSCPDQIAQALKQYKEKRG